MKTVYDLINETLNNLNGRTVQGLAACEMITYVVNQLVAINNACRKEEKARQEEEANHDADAK